MSTQIESIILPDVIWQDEFNFSGINSKVDESLEGRKIIWEGNKEGRPITLVGSNDTGWILRSVLKELYALSKVIKATYLLVYNGENYSVRFRNEEQPVLTAEPIISKSSPSDTDYYRNLVIKLMEV